MNRVRIGKEIRAVHNLFRRRVNESQDMQAINKMTGTNGWIIGYIARNPHKEIFQRDLEKEMTITRSTASKVVTLMKKKGLIIRESVDYDARLKKLVLTDKALALHVAITSYINRTEDRIIKGFSQDEIELLQSFMHRMKTNLE